MVLRRWREKGLLGLAGLRCRRLLDDNASCLNLMFPTRCVKHIPSSPRESRSFAVLLRLWQKILLDLFVTGGLVSNPVDSYRSRLSLVLLVPASISSNKC
ncbi:hypothetical protein Tco_0546928 [Tanacetum coccineum]